MRLVSILALFLIAAPVASANDGERLAALAIERGVCVLWNTRADDATLRLARDRELAVFVQSNDRAELGRLRDRAAEAGLLGTRLYAEYEDGNRIHLAANLADAVVLGEGLSLDNPEVRREVTRVLHPGARALAGEVLFEKPFPPGSDSWSHPYHGPDNNPQSRDRHARAPYLTQFLSEPWYAPMPQVTVAAGGRVFKAFGHIALKQREWPWLNTLVAINGYNGTHLWKRPLAPGFMIHRSALIATPETLYLADGDVCRVLDAATGEERGEIVIPEPIDPDGVWKWMAFEEGVLYALVGPAEPADAVIRGRRTRPGWPWSELGEGYAGPYSWGFGRTLVALDPETQEVLWTHPSEHPLDSRAMCLAAGRIYLYSHQQFLAAVDASTGRELWKTTDQSLLASIGAHERAQNPRQGFASTAYAKANEHGIYFAGPQRSRLVAASAADGRLLWDYPQGNFQLVLRDDGLYALGRLETSKKFDYLTGDILADLECYRGNCTRATGTLDSIFTRGYRHTGTMRLDVATNDALRISNMRPGCQDGVIVSDGMLYWGPWMCDCNHSLVGLIALAPAGDFEFNREATDGERLEAESAAEQRVESQATSFERTPSPPAPLPEGEGRGGRSGAQPGEGSRRATQSARDWSSYRAGPNRSASTAARAPTTVKKLWELQSPSRSAATAPVTGAGQTIWGGADGMIRAVATSSGQSAWTAWTGGSLVFPPEVAEGRVYAGSGDGFVYCFDAASGRRLWRFRAAPADQKILVHGKLLSRWPVGSGVLVADGVVYAAAGIASYDGTHVYALDAATGRLRWQNNSSGRLVDERRVTGVSVQGHLLLHDGKLYLAGGNVVSPAIYDIETGRCLNEVTNEWWERPSSTSERFPSRPQTEMFRRSPRGRELFVVDGEVRVFDQLLYSPSKYGQSRYFGGHFLQAASADAVIRGTTGRIVRIANAAADDGQPAGIWESDRFEDPLALALCENAVVVAGRSANDAATIPADAEQPAAVYEIAALDLSDGGLLWSQRLPAPPTEWGVAVGPGGHVIVTHADGRVVAFGAVD